MPGTALEETGFPGPPVLFPRPDPSLWLLAAAPESGGQGREWQGRPGHWPCGVTGGEVPGGVHVAKGREGNERQPVSRPNLLPGTGRPPGARPGPARVLPDSSGPANRELEGRAVWAVLPALHEPQLVRVKRVTTAG